MPSFIYALLGPLIALVSVQLALKIEGEPDLFYQGAFPLTAGLFYLCGAVPGVLLARVFGAVGLHRIRIDARVVLVVMGLLCAGAALAYGASHLEVYMAFVPPVVLCWLLTSRLSAGRTT